MAIIGQPNAGKSTLINRMLGEERLLTGPEAGITRDSICRRLVLARSSVQAVRYGRDPAQGQGSGEAREALCGDALRAIRFAEVVILMMDATEPLEKQDLQLADMVADEGRAIVLALNKWDLVPKPQARLAELRADLKETLAQIRGVPMVPISGLTGAGLDRLMETVMTVYATWNRRVSTAALNRWLYAVTQSHPPPAVSGRRIKLKYLTQSKTRPPTFFLSCSRPDALPESYRRYIVNGLREDFDLAGVPIRLMLRRDSKPVRGEEAEGVGVWLAGQCAP